MLNVSLNLKSCHRQRTELHIWSEIMSGVTCVRPELIRHTQSILLSLWAQQARTHTHGEGPACEPFPPLQNTPNHTHSPDGHFQPALPGARSVISSTQNKSDLYSYKARKAGTGPLQSLTTTLIGPPPHLSRHREASCLPVDATGPLPRAAHTPQTQKLKSHTEA